MEAVTIQRSSIFITFTSTIPEMTSNLRNFKLLAITMIIQYNAIGQFKPNTDVDIDQAV